MKIRTSVPLTRRVCRLVLVSAAIVLLVSNTAEGAAASLRHRKLEEEDTVAPTTAAATAAPTTSAPTGPSETIAPTTSAPTGPSETIAPTTSAPTGPSATVAPTTNAPTAPGATIAPTTPITTAPTTAAPTSAPTLSMSPSMAPVPLADRIQEEINSELPDYNFELRRDLADPSPLDLETTVDMGCETLGLSMSFSEILGLSSINVRNITVTPGSESIDELCFGRENWQAATDLIIVFNENLVAPIRSTQASLVGRCRGRNYNQPLSVSVRATPASYTGKANMKGTFGCLRDRITGFEVLGTLDLSPGTGFPVTVSQIPPELSDLEPTITSQLAAAFRSQLVRDIEPLVRRELEQAIDPRLISTVEGGNSTLFGTSTPFFSGLLDTVLDVFGLGGDD